MDNTDLAIIFEALETITHALLTGSADHDELVRTYDMVQSLANHYRYIDEE